MDDIESSILAYAKSNISSIKSMGGHFIPISASIQNHRFAFSQCKSFKEWLKENDSKKFEEYGNGGDDLPMYSSADFADWYRKSQTQERTPEHFVKNASGVMESLKKYKAKIQRAVTSTPTEKEKKDAMKYVKKFGTEDFFKLKMGDFHALNKYTEDLCFSSKDQFAHVKDPNEKKMMEWLNAKDLTKTTVSAFITEKMPLLVIYEKERKVINMDVNEVNGVRSLLNLLCNWKKSKDPRIIEIVSAMSATAKLPNDTLTLKTNEDVKTSESDASSKLTTDMKTPKSDTLENDIMTFSLSKAAEATFNLSKSWSIDKTTHDVEKSTDKNEIENAATSKMDSVAKVNIESKVHLKQIEPEKSATFKMDNILKNDIDNKKDETEKSAASKLDKVKTENVAETNQTIKEVESKANALSREENLKATVNGSRTTRTGISHIIGELIKQKIDYYMGLSSNERIELQKALKKMTENGEKLTSFMGPRTHKHTIESALVVFENEMFILNALRGI